MNDTTKVEIAKAALKELGKLTLDGCKHEDREMANKFQELNRLAKKTYELLNE